MGTLDKFIAYRNNKKAPTPKKVVEETDIYDHAETSEESDTSSED